MTTEGIQRAVDAIYDDATDDSEACGISVGIAVAFARRSKLTILSLVCCIGCAGEPFAFGGSYDGGPARISNLTNDGGADTSNADRTRIDGPSNIEYDSGSYSGGPTDSGYIPQGGYDSGNVADSAGGPSTGGQPAVTLCIADKCPSSTYGERGCCRNSITCGVVFVGAGHACIEYR